MYSDLVQLNNLSQRRSRLPSETTCSVKAQINWLELTQIASALGYNFVIRVVVASLQAYRSAGVPYALHRLHEVANISMTPYCC